MKFFVILVLFLTPLFAFSQIKSQGSNPFGLKTTVQKLKPYPEANEILTYSSATDYWTPRVIFLSGTVNDSTDAGGQYVLTHSLGDVDYSIVVTPHDSVAIHSQIKTKAANTTTFVFFTTAGTARATNAIRFDWFLRRTD